VLSSAANTPQLDPFSISATSEPSSVASSPRSSDAGLIPLEDIPPLSLDALQTEEEKTEGLELVSESVSQMHLRGAASVALHPSCFMPVAAVMCGAYYAIGMQSRGRICATLFIGFGLAVYIAAAIRYSSEYRSLAKSYDWSWLEKDGPGRDIMLGARYNDDLVGVVVLRLSPKVTPTGGRRRGRSLSFKGGRGIIRAWTTQAQHRGRGIGKDLLGAAVRLTKERCGKDAQLGFSQDHANSVMLLNARFNDVFRAKEVRATKALSEAVASWEGQKKSKKGKK
jgi:GNAT superfamily N-acetyltransferase